MSPRQLVEKMRDEKGITFKYVSEKNAEKFLSEKNNYIRTACYRKLFSKYEKGRNTGKYIDLDFGYLKELSIIDMHYRFIIEKMCSDIEHCLCTKIISLIDNDNNTDGYDVVFQYLQKRPNSLSSIEKAISSPQTGDLIKKNFTVDANNRIIKFDDCPAWIFTEIITFGDVIHFYKFYCKSRKIFSEPTEVLHLIRSLRNAAAHNNCLLVDLRSGSSKSPQALSVAISKISNLSNSQRAKKLSCRSILEFVALLYEYDRLVTDKIRKHRIKQLKDFFYGRMIEKKNFFVNNDLLRTTYEFAVKVIDGFFPGY